MNVIYLSGGIGKRTKLGYPKQFAYLYSKPIMIYALEILEKMPEIDRIIIPTSDVIRTLNLIKRYAIDKAEVIEGGPTRQASSFIGLQQCDSDYVLVMEAVRPFVTEEFIRYIIETPGDFITPIERALCSVITIDGNYVDRKTIGEVQMPQKYNRLLLYHAHKETKLKDASDDAVIMIEQGHGNKLKWAAPLEGNIKITTPLDLKIAEAIYVCNYNRE